MESETNDRPRLLPAIVAAIAAFLTGGGLATEDSEAATTTDPLDDALLREINATRREHGLKPVRSSPGLDRAATARSKDMARRGYFGHTLPGGTRFTSRVLLSYPARGFRSWLVGENLFWSVPLRDSRFVVQAWLNSPPHRRVLLYPGWNDAGIGAVRADVAPGAYGNRPVTVVTAEFGVRRR